MVVDRRHDHSFRIPRPDLSAKLGTPNACNDCHADKSEEWAAAAIEGWHGPVRKGFQTYAEAFHSAWSEKADAAALLAAVASDGHAPAFARASALTELAPYVSPANIGLARAGLWDPDPMVRIGALDMLARVPANQLWPLVSPLLWDSNRGVRIRAAALLAAIPTAGQPAADRERFKRAATEFVAAQHLNADRPEARSTLGNFYARRGLASQAEAEYRAALRLSPQFAPRRSISPISTASSGATVRARLHCARRSKPHPGTQGCIMPWGLRSPASNEQTRQLPSCAGRPSSSRIARAMPMFMRSRSIRLAAAKRQSLCSGTAWQGI